MKYCNTCQRYTLEDICPYCHQETRRAEPARFSPQDTYGDYRRKLKLHQKEVTKNDAEEY